jgi:hypothetical protein
MPPRSSRESNLNHPETSQTTSPAIAERITVALVPKASADLQRTQSRTQLSKTDIVNRAVSFYEFADAEQTAGSELIIRRPSGEEHIVRLL